MFRFRDVRYVWQAASRGLLFMVLAGPACASSQLQAQAARPDAHAAAPAGPGWVARSDRFAQVLVRAEAAFDPEAFSELGLVEYDRQVIDFTADREPRLRAALRAAQDELRQQLQGEQDRHVRQDLELMIAAADRERRLSAASERLLMPWTDVPRLVFYGIHQLLSDQVAAARRDSALPRLQRYVGLAPSSRAILALARERWELNASNKALLRPSRLEVERLLRTIEPLRSGIHDLFSRYAVTGAAPALAALDEQLAAYAAWVRAEVLPAARDSTLLPAELYALLLENVGVNVEPAQLLRNAQLEFMETRAAMQLVAQRIAQARGLADDDYRVVLRGLKAQPLPEAEVEQAYRDVNREIEAIVRREHIVTLPARPMVMRLATSAENAGQPAPHFLPPPLRGNTGEQGQFVLTTGMKSEREKDEPFDDFNYPAVRWTLSAHEGRPGHELQFSSLIENGVSLARSFFAFNSVNVEGWALYAEAEMLPFEPLEAQLVTLQFRLLRAARAMLDPMLNLGMIEREQAGALLRDDVVLSRPMAHQELDRYTFDAPGQATSYYYGYSRLQALRAETELMLGDKFDRKAFNDFVLAQGMLPPDLLARAVHEEHIPAQLAQDRSVKQASAAALTRPGG